MAKGGFETKKLDKKKEIQVVVEDEKPPMVIIREEGNPPVVTDGEGPVDNPPGLDLKNLPPDTVVFTHTNPTCGYYYFNRKWWYR